MSTDATTMIPITAPGTVTADLEVPVTVTAGLYLTAIANAATAAESSGTPWFQRVLVGMEVGPTGAQFGGGRHASDYARDFDGAEIVRRCVAAKAEYLVIWVRDGDFTFHDSKRVPRPLGLGNRDVLRQAQVIEADSRAREAGVGDGLTRAGHDVLRESAAYFLLVELLDVCLQRVEPHGLRLVGDVRRVHELRRADMRNPGR
jgi:hypothetical protein